MISRAKKWIRNNPKEFCILLFVLLVGAFVRLYRINEYMTFLGDEGRDVIIVRRLLVEGHPPLIGPGTSIGNMYLGPLYYYLMAPALFLANFSPVGPAVQIAILGIITIALVWWVGREWFGPRAGLVAASLYAIAPIVIIYSRSSWNPNIMPFFALVSMYAVWRVWTHHEFAWLAVLGASFAASLQSHYLGLLLAPTLLLFWVLTIRDLRLKGEWQVAKGKFWRYSAFGLIIFLTLMSPLVIFDARHGWNNFSAMKTFFAARQATVSFRPWSALPNMWPIWEKVTAGLLTAKTGVLTAVFSALGALAVLATLVGFRRTKETQQKAYLLLFSWLGFALLGLGLYKQEIYDHYFGFFFAAPFLLVGAIGQKAIGYKRKAISISFLVAYFLLLITNLAQSPILKNPTYQLQRAEIVAQKVKEESHNQDYNLAVIAERNYEDGYEYFLRLWKTPIVDIDAQKPQTITNQLFVICEMPKEKCSPTSSPKAEVANFGWSKIENGWDDVYGVTLYKLGHVKALK